MKVKMHFGFIGNIKVLFFFVIVLVLSTYCTKEQSKSDRIDVKIRNISSFPISNVKMYLIKGFGTENPDTLTNELKISDINKKSISTFSYDCENHITEEYEKIYLEYTFRNKKLSYAFIGVVDKELLSNSLEYTIFVDGSLMTEFAKVYE
jgi:hypothetical protein